MKKKLFVLFAILTLTFVFSTTCFAAKSPNVNTRPEQESPVPGDGEGGNGDGEGNGGNTSGTSPQTGYDFTLYFVAMITTAGVVLVSRKKFLNAK